MQYTSNELLWIKASSAYYESQNNKSILPIMSDEAFDALTEKIKKDGSKLPDEWVGGDEGDTKHPTPMLSLEKIKFKTNINDNITLDEINKFLNIYPNITKFVELKFDGHGYNFIYKINTNNTITLDKVLTRGRNGKGINKIHKLRYIVPNILDINKLSNLNLNYYNKYITEDIYSYIEIRGEFLMKEKTFNDKYKETDSKGNVIKNSRTIAGGILSKDDKNFNELNDLYFCAFELRLSKSDETYVYLYDNNLALKELGFNTKYIPPVKTITNILDFKTVYDYYKNLRDNNKLEFQIDGLVIKYPNINNDNQLFINMGFTSHHPKGAIAIKFPSSENISEIIGYEWNTGFTGEITPKLLINPIVINGSTITKTTGHNLSIIEERGLYIGAQVIDRKSVV